MCFYPQKPKYFSDLPCKRVLKNNTIHLNRFQTLCLHLVNKVLTLFNIY